jgi:predicted TIM-barrel fold metal-dependent hydrolase
VVNFSLVDAHHHLWDLAEVDYPWLRASGVRRFFGDPTPIQRNFGVADLRAEAAGIEIANSVHIQVGCAPGSELDETRFIERTAERDGLPTALVVAADLTSDYLAEILRRHRQASGRLRGVRQIVGREPADDERTGSGRILQNPQFLSGLRRLADEGLSFDLQLCVPQIPAVVTLLEAVPDLRVALCHVGSPWDLSQRGIDEWAGGLKALGALPNVHCKLSGISMFEPNWTDETFSRIIQVVVDSFGIQRCFFGSNFPVDGLHRNYADIVRATRDAIKPWGTYGEDRVFRLNARTFYRL